MHERMRAEGGSPGNEVAVRLHVECAALPRILPTALTARAPLNVARLPLLKVCMGGGATKAEAPAANESADAAINTLTSPDTLPLNFPAHDVGLSGTNHADVAFGRAC